MFSMARLDARPNYRSSVPVIPLASQLRVLMNQPEAVQKSFFMEHILLSMQQGVRPKVMRSYTRRGASRLYIYLTALPFGCYAILDNERIVICRGKDNLDNPIPFNDLVYQLNRDLFLSSARLGVSYWEYKFVQDVLNWVAATL